MSSIRSDEGRNEFLQNITSMERQCCINLKLVLGKYYGQSFKTKITKDVNYLSI